MYVYLYIYIFIKKVLSAIVHKQPRPPSPIKNRSRETKYNLSHATACTSMHIDGGGELPKKADKRSNHYAIIFPSRQIGQSVSLLYDIIHSESRRTCRVNIYIYIRGSLDLASDQGI